MTVLSQELVESVTLHPLGHSGDGNSLATPQLQVLVDVVEEGDADERVGQAFDLREVDVA